MNSIFKYLFILTIFASIRSNELPSRFNLRQEYNLPNRKQSWGTCWAFSSIRSIESNIQRSKSWNESPLVEFGLSEYHMDKFSGFTKNGAHGDRVRDWYSGQGSDYNGSNFDDENSGLTVHIGGDYKIAAAYLANNGGAVNRWANNNISSSHIDHDKFSLIKRSDNYIYYLPDDIEWLGSLSVDEIKEYIIQNGAISSVQFMTNEPLGMLSPNEEFHFYYGDSEVNHAINIIGWDDEAVVSPLKKGAWIVEDSDHRDNLELHIGTFYISYHDKYLTNNKEMGAVGFRNVSKHQFSKIYSHSLHGWQYEFSPSNIEAIKNVYKIDSTEKISGVGIFTTIPDEKIKILIKSREQICADFQRSFLFPGFHYLKVDCDPNIKIDENIEITIQSDKSKYALDATKIYKLLLNSSLPKMGEPIEVKSKANPGESFYKVNNKWRDLFDYKWPKLESYGIRVNRNKTANFPINLYTIKNDE